MKDVRRKSNKREHTAIYQRIIVRIIPSLFIYVPDLFAGKIFLLKNQSFWNEFFLMKIYSKTGEILLKKIYKFWDIL